MIGQRTPTLTTFHVVDLVNMVVARFGPWTTWKIQGLYIHLPLYMWHRVIAYKLYQVPMVECKKNNSWKFNLFFNTYSNIWKYEYDFWNLEWLVYICARVKNLQNKFLPNKSHLNFIFLKYICIHTISIDYI